MSSWIKAISFSTILAILFLFFSPAASAQLNTLTGTLPDGANYLIEVPGNWNHGVLFLYSHGFVGPGSPNPALDVGDPLTRAFMLSSGFALAGSSYATTGWAIHEAIPDQIAVLDLFTQMVGTPTRTIAWGHSLGGMITAGLIQRFGFVFAARAELEFRAQGNPSSNVGVNYRSLLARSIDRDEVVALYEQAGLDLNADLQTLQDTVRITADPGAVHYLESNIIFDGQIGIPVLTMHTEGDGLVLVQNESAYNNVVSETGDSAFLRQTFVHRAGHCAFTPAETIAAVLSLLFRLNTGAWGPLDPNSMNTAASALGPFFNIFPTSAGLAPTPPAYFDFTPSQLLRPFDALGGGCQSDPVCRAQFQAP